MNRGATGVRRTRGRWTGVVLGAVLGLAMTSSSTAAPGAPVVRQPSPALAEAAHADDHAEPVCTSILTDDEQAAFYGVTSRPGPVRFDVLVLLDDVDHFLAEQLLRKAQESYAPLQIELVPVEYRIVSFQGTETSKLLAQVRDAVGGRRPNGIDAVVALTSKDIFGGTQYTAGQVDCVGGVQFRKAGFVIAEARRERPYEISGTKWFLYLQARIVSHEIGHVLGAHHHYANCVEGVPSEALEFEVSPCTLMFNDVSLASMNFSALNAQVVRGYADRYARP